MCDMRNDCECETTVTASTTQADFYCSALNKEISVYDLEMDVCEECGEADLRTIR